MTIEDDIMKTLNDILQKTVEIDTSVKYADKQKEDSKRYFREALDVCEEELDPIKIQKIVSQEYRKWLVKREEQK